mmetsp:Transcript_38110/g.108821  ORF Transcript_38110/g.108821 Transcript_38110/m.108821 type:complete len:221 (-) Transcript_38110:383-1045(-)
MDRGGGGCDGWGDLDDGRQCAVACGLCDAVGSAAFDAQHLSDHVRDVLPELGLTAQQQCTDQSSRLQVQVSAHEAALPWQQPQTLDPHPIAPQQLHDLRHPRDVARRPVVGGLLQVELEAPHGADAVGGVQELAQAHPSRLGDDLVIARHADDLLESLPEHQQPMHVVLSPAVPRDALVAGWCDRLRGEEGVGAGRVRGRGRARGRVVCVGLGEGLHLEP